MILNFELAITIVILVALAIRFLFSEKDHYLRFFSLLIIFAMIVSIFTFIFVGYQIFSGKLGTLLDWISAIIAIVIGMVCILFSLFRIKGSSKKKYVEPLGGMTKEPY